MQTPGGQRKSLPLGEGSWFQKVKLVLAIAKRRQVEIRCHVQNALVSVARLEDVVDDDDCVVNSIIERPDWLAWPFPSPPSNLTKISPTSGNVPSSCGLEGRVLA